MEVSDDDKCIYCCASTYMVIFLTISVECLLPGLVLDNQSLIITGSIFAAMGLSCLLFLFCAVFGICLEKRYKKCIQPIV